MFTTMNFASAPEAPWHKYCANRVFSLLEGPWACVTVKFVKIIASDSTRKVSNKWNDLWHYWMYESDRGLMSRWNRKHARSTHTACTSAIVQRQLFIYTLFATNTTGFIDVVNHTVRKVQWAWNDIWKLASLINSAPCQLDLELSMDASVHFTACAK